MQSVSVVGISVNHGEPVEVEPNFFRTNFWLALKIDTGSTIGVGTSPTVAIILKRDHIEEVRASTFRIQMEAQRHVKSMDLNEALLSFAAILDELARGEEPEDA